MIFAIITQRQQGGCEKEQLYYGLNLLLPQYVSNHKKQAGYETKLSDMLCLSSISCAHSQSVVHVPDVTV